jgi:hypothetical protein
LFRAQEKVVAANNFLWFGLVMVGLKSFLYELGPLLGTTGIALYERQRLLVNLGVVEAVPGRGPGSGVPLTANNIAAMIISVLAADAPSEIDQTVAALCNATAKRGGDPRQIAKLLGGDRGVVPTAKSSAPVSAATKKALEALKDAMLADLEQQAGAPVADIGKQLQEKHQEALNRKGKPMTFKEALGRVLSGHVEKPINSFAVAVRVLRPAQGQIDITTGMPFSFPTPIKFQVRGVRGADAPGPIQISAEISKPVLDQLTDLTCSALKAESEEDEK